MKTIAIISQKGGSGKTTIAVHLAVCASQQNLKTALLDIDPQASAYEWNEARGEARLNAVKAQAGQLQGYLTTAAANGLDLAIIDTSGRSDGDSAIAAALADLILIPCRPYRFDLRSVTSTLKMAKLATASKKYYLVMNGAPRGNLASASIEALEKSIGSLRVIGPILLHRAAYCHSITDGRSVHEYEPHGKAAEEIDDLYYNISGILGLRAKQPLTEEQS
jgi:chromosome partitioning protein